MNILINLYRHLKGTHSEIYEKYAAAEGKSTKVSPSQTSMKSFIGVQSSNIYGQNHPQQLKFRESLVAT